MLKFLKNLFNEGPGLSETDFLNGAVVLDVRPPCEYQQDHLRGSKNIPISEIGSKVELIRQWNRPVITVCRSGVRSAVAKSVLDAAGIEVYHGGTWTNLKTL